MKSGVIKAEAVSTIVAAADRPFTLRNRNTSVCILNFLHLCERGDSDLELLEIPHEMPGPMTGLWTTNQYDPHINTSAIKTANTDTRRWSRRVVPSLLRSNSAFRIPQQIYTLRCGLSMQADGRRTLRRRRKGAGLNSRTTTRAPRASLPH